MACSPSAACRKVKGVPHFLLASLNKSKVVRTVLHIKDGLRRVVAAVHNHQSCIIRRKTTRTVVRRAFITPLSAHEYHRAGASDYGVNTPFPSRSNSRPMMSGFPALIGAQQLAPRLGIELDAATGRRRALEDDVLDLLDVDARAANLVHDERQHAHPVVMADDELPLRRRARSQVDAIQHHARSGRRSG